MIIDFNASETLTEYETDICIIGSGAAALAMLTKLYDSKYQVIVLEAGGEKITDQNQDIYNVITPFHPFNGAREGRFRVFGGTTTRWGGQALPLDEIDFTYRYWIPFSGWPIAYYEVAKYHNEADSFLNTRNYEYDTDIYQLLKKPPLPPDKELAFRFSKLSPVPNIREKYRKQIRKSKHITLIQNANLCRIDLTDNREAVKKITFKNFENKTGHIRAKKFILACGGIENTRLLLASNHELKNGIGNSHDVVGRFLQDHPTAHVGRFSNPDDRIQQYFNSFYISKTRFRPRFLVSEEFQKSHRILNASATLEFLTGKDHPYFLTKEIYRRYMRGQMSRQDFTTMLKLIKHLPDLFKIGKNFLFGRKVYTPGADVNLKLMVETGPLWENRVQLSKEPDKLGMPRAIVSFKIDEQILRTFYTCSAYLKQYFENCGLGEFQLADWVKNGEWDNNKIIDSKHHIGTTRMSCFRNDGVVDTNCKVFDVGNLYIAGSSVFPTSGHSNPTFTIIALAFRLAEHIVSELAEEASFTTDQRKRVPVSRLAPLPDL